MSKEITLKEVEEKLDAISQEPEKYFRDEDGNLKEANTSTVSALGKMVLITDRSVADHEFKYGKLNNLQLPDIKDRFRGSLGSYWTNRYPYAKDKKELVFLRREVKDPGPLRIWGNQFNTAVDLENSTFGATREWLLVGADTQKFKTQAGVFSEGKMKAYLLGGTSEGTAHEGIVKKNKWFYDHAFTMHTPFKKSEIERLNSGLRTLYGSVEPVYNFYMQHYENVCKSDFATEQTLPNMYVFFAHKKAAEIFKEEKEKVRAGKSSTVTPVNPWFEKLITLGGKLRKENATAMTMPLDEREKHDIRKKPAGQYYDMWAHQYQSAKNSGGFEAVNEKYKNIIFPLGDMELLNSSNQSSHLFPMYAEVEFNTDLTTEFAEVLETTQLSSALCADVHEAVNNRDMKIFPTFEATTVNMLAGRIGGAASELFSKTSFRTDKNKRTFDITEWYKKFTDLKSPGLTGGTGDLFDGYDSNNSILLGAYANEKKVSRDPQYSFWKSLMAVIFSGKLRKIIKKHRRSFRDIVEGKEAYHETVMYRVAKYKGQPGPRKEPLQNFYFPNSNEVDVIKYVDTQVRYDETYTYVVYAYELVVGAKYKYINTMHNWGKYAAVQVHVEPSLQLVEIPYFMKELRMVDNPPVMPDIEFVPYRAVNNRVRLQFNGNVGKYKLMPEIINTRDIQQIEKFRKVQDSLPGEPIEYESDDHPKYFQIWRTTEQPSSYADFAGKLRKSVATDVNVGDPLRATSATFIDKIKPNTKYYYTFRSVDIHGHISYPTPIYEYEMVDDAGSIYPLMRVVPMVPEVPKEPTKSAKRYIRILPAMGQRLLDYERIEEVDTAKDLKEVPLGLEGEQVWGKRFKIRLTSKNTGKKIDLNISFGHEHKVDKG